LIEALMRIVIADVTRANPGTESSLLDRLRDHLADVGELIVVARSDQSPTFEPQHSIRRAEPYHYTNVVRMVSDILAEKLDTPDTTVTVYSFHVAVVDLKSTLAGEARTRCNFFPWSALNYLGTRAPSALARPFRAPQLQTWPDALISRSDALDVLDKALTQAGAVSPETSARKSDLRSLLIFDNRFRKENPAAPVGLISLLFGEAKALPRRFGVDEKDKINPKIWLASEAATQEVPAKPRPETASRSQRFIDALRDAGLGPYSQVRRDLFTFLAVAVKDGTAKGAPLKLRAAVNAAISSTRALYKGKVPDTFNWGKLAKFLYQILERSPVALGQGGVPIVPSIEALSTLVIGLAPEYEVLLDAELVLELVRRFDDIQLHDVQPLAGALYLLRDNDAQERVVTVLEYLLGTKGIVQTADRCLAVGPSQHAEDLAPAASGSDGG
jgi:hypothetical protein